MFRKSGVIVSLIFMLLAAGVAQAQGSDTGSIRGTVFEDTNSDGKCGVGDPVVPGVAIRFDSGGESLLYLQSGDDGTFALVAAGFGTWKVSAEAPAGWVVSSEETVEVTLSDASTESRLALGVDFCLAQAGTGGGGVAATVLPEAGASLAPRLAVWLGMGGLLLVLGGLALELRRRHAGS